MYRNISDMSLSSLMWMILLIPVSQVLPKNTIGYTPTWPPSTGMFDGLQYCEYKSEWGTQISGRLLMGQSSLGQVWLFSDTGWFSTNQNLLPLIQGKSQLPATCLIGSQHFWYLRYIQSVTLHATRYMHKF